MSALPHLDAETIAAVASWPLLIEALREGHRGARARLADSFINRGEDTLLTRSAWIEGLASGTKTATITASNGARGLPNVQALMTLFDPETGEPRATVDATPLTAWKTAADSALGCDLLARTEPTTLLMIGAGAMAAPLIAAHRTVRPSLERVLIWNRTSANAEALADTLAGAQAVASLPEAVAQADIVCAATMSSQPFIPGEALRPGTHLDLVGAFRADKREADDACHHRGTWFVDSFETTLDHIGELCEPLERGLITRDAIRGDLNDLVAGRAGRSDAEQITVFKNGGGAHLDIMVAMALLEAAGF